MPIQKILSGNRITIPQEFMDKWNLREGDELMIDVVADGTIIVNAVDVHIRKTKVVG